MVDELFVLSEKMFSFCVVCHVVWNGDGNVILDAVYD